MNNMLKYIDAGYCLFMAILIYNVFSLDRWFEKSVWWALVIIVIYYAIYFITRLIIVPMLFHGKLKGMEALCIIAAQAVIIAALTYDKPGWPFDILTDDHTQAFAAITHQRAWLLFLNIQSFALAIGLLNQVNRQHLQLLEAEHERDKTSLLLFRAQLNPHFLYNTLNSLYSLIVTNQGQKAEEAFVKLADMTRYTSRISQYEKVAVGEEVDYLRNYIALQQMRMEHPEHIRFSYSSEKPDAVIAPMLLTTFVGNALKYGTQTGSAGDVTISLHVDARGKLLLSTSNPISPPSALSEKTSAGTGIENCRRRLKLLYPNRHQLDISEHDNQFDVLLQMQL